MTWLRSSGTPQREQIEAASLALAWYSVTVYRGRLAKPSCSIPIDRVL